MFTHRLNPSMRFHLASLRGWFIFVMVGCLCLPAADIPQQEQSLSGTGSESVTNAPLKQIRPGVFELGQVRLDKNKRTVSFPASVNMREGNIEYVVVTATGKTHESLLRTTAEPYHVQLAFLLLGAKGAGTNALPEDPARSLPGERVEIEFSWDAGGRTNSFQAEEFVHDRKANGPARRSNWIYTGSRLREDGFAAQLDGSIVSLITDADALINNPRPGREDDDNWLVRTNNLPPLHAPVEVTIRLAR
jgi:hypothetical protein